MRLLLAKASAVMVLSLLCLVSARHGLAQTNSLSLSSGTTTPSGTVSLNLTLTSPSGSQPAAVQWNLTYPAANVLSLSATAGPAATAAGKSLACAGSSGTYTCIAYGLTASTMANGVVAIVNLTTASSVTSTSIGVGSASAASASGMALSISATGGTVTGPATSPSLSAAYGFNEGTGTTTADMSGNGITGQLQGATWTGSGKHGNALSFNGTSSYVDLGTPASLQSTGSMTWSAWVYAAGNPPDDGQIVAMSDDNSGWQLKTTPDTGVRTFGIAISPDGAGHTQRYSKTVVVAEHLVSRGRRVQRHCPNPGYLRERRAG